MSSSGSAHHFDAAAALEIGLIASLGVLVTGLALLFVGRATESTARLRGEGQAPPAPGAVPEERHQHTATMSAR